MPLDPQCAAVIAAVEGSGNAFSEKGVDGARAAYAATTALYVRSFPDMKRVRNRVIPALDGSNIPVRIYDPHVPDGPSAAPPMLVFFHGGGFVFGDLDTHDCLCRELAARAECLVVSVEYRLAPEFKFPVPLDDCMAVLIWVTENADALGGDPKRIAVGGDSAGGNLAAVVARRQRDRGGPPLALQLLIYPTTDFLPENHSINENANGYLLTKAGIEQFRDYYLNNEDERLHPHASPLRAEEFDGLPPAFVATAEFDPLRDEGADYAGKLEAAGVPVEYHCYDGMVHGFFRMGGLVHKTALALDDSARALRRAFAA